LRLALLMASLVMLWATPGSAHELRPAYLQIDEAQPGRYEVLWKRPQRGGRGLSLSVTWPEGCRDALPALSEMVAGAAIERRLIDCGAAGLVGQRIGIDGLAATFTDALVRIRFSDGRVQTNLLKPASPELEIEGSRLAQAIAADYLLLGVGHILGGIDHLLFVLGLILIVRRSRTLLLTTVTAFTLAHSITLAAAALGVVEMPQAPVEAVIALSILFLASELARQTRGQIGLTARAPWLVAFSFGLLHGVGFAGTLAEVGLPATDIPLSLLAFNLGVEAGQLIFIGAVLAVLWAGRRAIVAPPRWLPQVPAYAIGSLAAFWLIERVAAFG
jgi:hypothetical protein